MSRVRFASFALVALVALVASATLAGTAEASNNSCHKPQCFPSGGSCHPCYPKVNCFPSYPCYPSYPVCQPTIPCFDSYCVWYFDCGQWQCYKTCGSYSDACNYSNYFKSRGMNVKISKK